MVTINCIESFEKFSVHHEIVISVFVSRICQIYGCYISSWEFPCVSQRLEIQVIPYLIKFNDFMADISRFTFTYTREKFISATYFKIPTMMHFGEIVHSQFACQY